MNTNHIQFFSMCLRSQHRCHLSRHKDFSTLALHFFVSAQDIKILNMIFYSLGFSVLSHKTPLNAGLVRV